MPASVRFDPRALVPALVLLSGSAEPLAAQAALSASAGSRFAPRPVLHRTLVGPAPTPAAAFRNAAFRNAAFRNAAFGSRLGREMYAVIARIRRTTTQGAIA